MAVCRNASASTQSQALNAQVFLYIKVLGQTLGDIDAFVRGKRPQTLPTVLSHQEAMTLLGKLRGTHYLVIALLYGTGIGVFSPLDQRTRT